VNTQPEDTTTATPDEGPSGQPGEIIGVSVLRYPLFPHATKAVHEVAVLKRGAVDDYAVYVGVALEDVPFDRKSDLAAWTASFGTKASLSDALRHFPGIQPQHYRR